MQIRIPSNYPAESLVLFVMSTWHVLIALLISRAGVLRREPQAIAEATADEATPSVPGAPALN